MLQQASIWGLQNKKNEKYQKLENQWSRFSNFEILKSQISLQENQKLQRRELKYCLDARNLKIGFYKMKIITHELS